MKKENIKYFVIATFAMYLAPSLITFVTIWLSGGTLEFAHLFIIPALISVFAFVFGRLADNDNEYVEKLLEFMTSEQGRQIVRETGYII